MSPFMKIYDVKMSHDHETNIAKMEYIGQASAQKVYLEINLTSQDGSYLKIETPDGGACGLDAYAVTRGNYQAIWIRGNWESLEFFEAMRQFSQFISNVCQDE